MYACMYVLILYVYMYLSQVSGGNCWMTRACIRDRVRVRVCVFLSTSCMFTHAHCVCRYIRVCVCV